MSPSGIGHTRNIAGRNVRVGITAGLIKDYFVIEQGLKHVTGTLTSQIGQIGPLAVDAGLSYQHGMGVDGDKNGSASMGLRWAPQ